MNEAKNSATNSAEMVAIPPVKLDNLIVAAAQLKAGKLRPFMYAIQGPGGEAHIDEGCVAGDPAALAIEVNGLNDSPDAGYQIVPVYLAVQPVQQSAPVAILPIELSQFLTDVITAAGLMSHGRQDKGLAKRISRAAFALLTSPVAAASVQPAAHNDDYAVDEFAKMMKAKLAASRAKGRGGWDDPAQCSVQTLNQMLLEHVAKGDPVDVANLCMMLRHYNAKIVQPDSGTAASVQPFQQRVQPWMMECFGAEISADKDERNHRFFEESTELVQACGMTASEAHQLVDYVYGRPVGDPVQEVGGVMVTLAALCLAHGMDMHAAGETELARIWTKVDAIRAKQASKPKHSPLPQALPPDSGSDAAQFQAGVREGYERAAKALGERAAGWRRHGDHHLEEEVLHCRSMLHDQKPVAPASAGAGPAKAGVA